MTVIGGRRCEVQRMVQRMRAEESFGELRRVDLTRAVAVLYIQYCYDGRRMVERGACAVKS